VKPTNEVSDYAITIRVRNGRILSRMRGQGIETMAELSRLVGVGQTAIGKLVNMKELPYTKKGEWRETVWRIADVLQCDPEDLFNDQQRRAVIERNSAEIGMDAGQVAAVMGGNPEESSWAKIEAQRLLGCLDDNPRALAVVKGRAEGATLEELGREYSVTPARIRQIEFQAHRKMQIAAARGEKAAEAKMIWGDISNEVSNG
jgi:transcriptional regulator with XRE-family HTH domain